MAAIATRRVLFSGLVASAFLPVIPAFAQRGALLPDFADLAERILPAVVNISVTGSEAPRIPPELRGTPLERQFRDRFRGPQTQGAGSGFVIEASGFIVTNNHVIGNASRVTVGLQDGTELPARVVAVDDLTDLALLKVESRRSLPTVPWGSSAAMRVGNWVLAAGNPFALGGTITSGIISARGRDIGGAFDDFLQTDAPINPGNSGGPLFNTNGEVIGINTAIYSPSGASAGIGFAVPSDLARPVIEQLIRGGRVDRGWLGVSVQDAADMARGQRGALVMGVERGSPAARAGLRQGDVVVQLNGERLEGSRSLVRGVALLPPGQTVRLTLVRDGRQQEVAVQIGRRPATNG
ncbi:trypsin-like peptidase domain-containing protein [Plastoroseomonas hellenica]|uniref:PDZ domain-containing protein n=1 Tax=Plastoroseomonas hellenica TaxID=2687306 RepID=A0ABS5F546_9PROT|nr:trypsin-like peptidase domain-containing protein [Plastoroseomonas hellenica]MBR0645676.1 PDZ domain-containing protein [Plastoroseomonas hellenica]MBR0667701.1 PDZ domain-containing protein [Plastoroseomonas hellenica]